MALNRIEELIEDIRQGKMVVLMDDEDRENEGDLVMAAVKVRPEDINFMARYGRGLICLTLTPEHCRQLQLPLMVSDNQAAYATNFTVSIEAARGVTTGISAADRATTIQAAVAENAKPSDLVQPGHVFPLMAQPGGVLRRAGHTEAGCDLARLAGLPPAGVLVEILNEDGSMARRPDLEQFAAVHQLKIGTIADLIRFRVENEKAVKRVGQCQMPTEHGEFTLFAYQDVIDETVHFALVMGEHVFDDEVLVRVHISNVLCDLTSSTREECGWPLQNALQRIAQEGRGIVLILQQPQSSEQVIRMIQHYSRRDHGVELPATPSTTDLRTYGLGAQILLDLGVKKMRILSAPKKIHAISGFGLEVVDYVTH
ncbi:bifunctional 3,4-dihydroxy-2-butanone-4-phosphate synthase/GTP cyclohydrolase II [Thioflexithrix psekupsensis]|uniref:3,4-dihydroxy-2-butanone 4-phosphate synthase n=1 Tax=Thioflexithrix psekupsensis TaxID=1570016 RepID=A0A251XAL9_9GAMM|nr:bifunctional 3,4-dihydroxy-2-butanone-4-phosphate synthase/GTP cyclohydrolase II [Thioflexithrix psekupsensis]OUD15217.1 3,4-dihydroxy-2-butanone-4-phosphate synthase [Thioflexithrix psekupsensis]